MGKKITKNFLKLSVYNGTACVVDYDKISSHVVIPETADGCPVIGIDGSAFFHCEVLESLTIPKGVKDLDVGTFVECPNLREIIVDKDNTDYTSVDGALLSKDCTELICVPNISGTYIVPDTVEYIENSALYNCSKMNRLEIPESVTEIGDVSFECCTNLEYINVSIDNKSYTSIDGVLFNKACTELVRFPANRQGAYTVPTGVESIGDDAFSNCTKLTDITLPDSVTKLGWGAFYNCASLKSMVIPEGVTDIDIMVFSDCTSLESVTIPDGVTHLGKAAFFGCSSLKEIDLPESLESIFSEVFSKCESLESVTIPYSLEKISWGSFSGCTSLENFYVDDYNNKFAAKDGVLFSVAFFELVCFPAGRGGKYKIPKGVGRIRERAFYSCDKLTKVKIPKSVKFIEREAFDGCDSLTKIIYAGTEKQWRKIDIDSDNEYLDSVKIKFLG